MPTHIRARPGGGNSPADKPGRGPIMKIAAVIILALFIFGYLALCAYGIARTGSAAGLDAIGAGALALAVGALVWLVKAA